MQSLRLVRLSLARAQASLLCEAGSACRAFADGASRSDEEENQRGSSERRQQTARGDEQDAAAGALSAQLHRPAGDS
jgi:hypothetical protein